MSVKILSKPSPLQLLSRAGWKDESGGTTLTTPTRKIHWFSISFMANTHWVNQAFPPPPKC